MKRIVFINLTLVLTLAACAAYPAQGTLSPQRTSVPVPSETGTAPPTVASTAMPPVTPTVQLEGPFSSASHSTNIFHLKCDPVDIIFDISANDPNVRSVIFFFRMMDKGSGMASTWSNGEEMKTPGNGNFEFILRADAIPDEARYREAWLQYQFVAANKSRQAIGRSQIFAEQITFTPGCP